MCQKAVQTLYFDLSIYIFIWAINSKQTIKRRQSIGKEITISHNDLMTKDCPRKCEENTKFSRK